MERVLGAEVGEHLRRLHEGNGVKFHLGSRASPQLTSEKSTLKTAT